MNWLAAVVVALVLVACVSRPPESPIPSEVTDLNVAGSFNVAWTTQGAIAIVRDASDGPELRTQLEIIDRVNDGTPAVVPLRLDGCEPTVPAVPVSAEGSLLVAIDCPNSSPPRITLAQVNVDGGAASSVVDLPFLPNAFGTQDGGKTWIASYSSGFCAYIDRIEVTKPSESPVWPVEVRAGSDSFNVDDAREAANCDRTPLADDLSISLDGELAFVASADGLRLSGAARLDAVWSLYFAAVDGTAREVAGGFLRPTQVSWRPGSHAVAVAARLGRQWGVWLVDDSGHVTLLYEGQPTRFAWSPKGDALAIVELAGVEGSPSSPTRLIVVTLK